MGADSGSLQGTSGPGPALGSAGRLVPPHLEKGPLLVAPIWVPLGSLHPGETCRGTSEGHHLPGSPSAGSPAFFRPPL